MGKNQRWLFHEDDAWWRSMMTVQEWWIMDDEWRRANDERRIMNDDWWRTNYESWMMADEWWDDNELIKEFCSV